MILIGGLCATIEPGSQLKQNLVFCCYYLIRKKGLNKPFYRVKNMFKLIKGNKNSLK